MRSPWQRAVSYTHLDVYKRQQDIQSFFRDMKKYEEAMEVPVKNEEAIVYDYDSLASFRIQRQSILLDPAEP